MSWQEQGACWQSHADDFFVERGDSGRGSVRAKAVCARCPVTKECLDYALENRMDFGIWGGLTYKQRQDVRRARRSVA